MALPVEYEIEELEPKPYVSRPFKQRICVVDTETDPFLYGRVPRAFAVGFYDGETYVDFWGDDCVERYFEYLDARRRNGEQLLVYAHNGGKFDFYNSFMPWFHLDQEPLIIHGRLTKCHFAGVEHRDSYKIIPAPLRAYKKEEISYEKFERDVREQHRAEILRYQKLDCLYLYELIEKFAYTFGDCISIGEAAIKTLNSTVGFARMSAGQDKLMRPWFMGGRTQCFETGVISGDFKVYDVNSMYPSVMKDYRHPVGKEVNVSQRVDEATVFIKCDLARNDGAFARVTDTGIDFTCTSGEFFCTGHEFRVAEELGLIKVRKIITAVNVLQQATFADFVDRFYNLRLAAKAANDEVYTLLYKLLLNNAYGKFAQNPQDYCDYWLGDFGDLPEDFSEETRYSEANPDGWRVEAEYRTDNGGMWIWKKSSKNRWRGYRNVMTAASITGAARSVLLRGLSNAVRPIYCDTDSIICESLNADLDGARLGAWKLEAHGSKVAIAGKKLYAVFSDEPQGDDVAPVEGLYPIKRASKGANLSAAEILAVCRGRDVVYANPVPNFKLDGSAPFISRTITRTDRNVRKFGKVKIPSVF